MKHKSTLVFIYNSFKDPLFQNLVLSYITTLAEKDEKYRFYVITFEQENYQIGNDEQKKIQKNLNEKRIYWYPLTFHTGAFLLLKKMYDFLRSLLLVIYLRIVKRTAVIFAFANISASFSILFSKVLRMKFLVYSYEPHADFQVELGLWPKNSLKYKLLSTLEKYAGTHGDYILTGTKYMVETLLQSKAKGKIFRAPTSVDESRFYFKAEERTRMRKKYNIGKRSVLIYVGKFGGLYYDKEIPFLCKELHKINSTFFFLIVTPNQKEEIIQWFYKAGLKENDFLITGPFADVVPFLCAADMGLNAIPPTPAQKFRSPTKIAEYLLCGLPYITCKGISEDDIVAIENNVGVVLDSFDRGSVDSNISKIRSLLSENKEVQRERCRKVGQAYRGKTNVDKLLSRIYNETFCKF